MAKEAQVYSGQGVTYWGAEHKDGQGNLICKQSIVIPPDPIKCPSISCFKKFFITNLKYVLTLLYHEYRCTYAEAMRGKDIPMKYRTGDGVPESIFGLFMEILRVPHV
jgi:hypothetical protein